VLASLATGALGVAAIAVGWVVIQRAWGRAFAGECSDPDVLSGRRSCGGCSGSERCERGEDR